MITAVDTVLVPAEKSPEPGSKWVLNGIDRANLWLVLQGTWVFRGNLDADRIKGSLAELLSSCPHLAGRMVKGKVIDLSNEGVPVTVVSARELSVDDVQSQGMSVASFGDVPHKGRIKTGREAPMTVKLTELRDGWVLGVCCSHACLDGSGFYTMVATWSRICGGRPYDPPIVDQSLVPLRRARSKGEVLAAAREAGWSKFSPLTLLSALPAHLLGVFLDRAQAVHFSPEALLHLRDEASDSAASHRIGTNAALSAHLARACTRLLDHPSDGTGRLVTTVDGRERLEGVPSSYAGNVPCTVETSGLVPASPLGELAEVIHRSLAPMLTKPSPKLLEHFRLIGEVADSGALVLPYDASALLRRKPTLFYTNNYAAMPIYDVDFGDEASPSPPVVNVPHNTGDQILIWPTPPERGGIDVYLTGPIGRRVKQLSPDNPWWEDLRRG